MQVSASIDLKPFNDYVQKLAAETKRKTTEVIRYEAGAVLKLCASMQKISSAASIRLDNKFKRIKDEVGNNLTITKTGKVWYSPNSGETWRILGEGAKLAGGWKVSRIEWSKVRELLKQGKEKAKQETDRALGARGLAAKSWVTIFDSLFPGGVAGHSPKGARINPAALSAKSPALGSSSEAGAGQSNYVLTIENSSRVTVAQRGQQILDAAISRRAKAFENNLKHGVFRDAEALASQYGFMKITEIPAKVD